MQGEKYTPLKSVSRKNSTLQQYTKACQRIEYWSLKVMDLIGKHKIFEYFIKVAKICLEKKGFNTCYLLYCTLTRQSIKHSHQWNKMKKSKLQSYEKLNHIFDMKNNYKQYRTQCVCEECLPISVIWLHDIVNINCLQNILDENGLYNFSKLRAIGKAVNELMKWQKVDLKLNKIDVVQKVIEHIVVPDLTQK